MKTNFLDKFLKRIPFFTLSKIPNTDLNYDSIAIKYNSLSILYSLVLSFTAFIVNKLDIFYLSDNSKMKILSEKVFIFYWILVLYVFVLFMALLFTRKQKVKILLISFILVVQEAFLIYMFLVINDNIETTTISDNKNKNETLNNNNNDDNSNNNLIELNFLLNAKNKLEQIEILKNFLFLFSIQHHCFANFFNVKIPGSNNPDNIGIGIVLMFHLCKLIEFLVFIFQIKIEISYKILFKEIIFYLLIIIGSIIKNKSNSSLKFKINNLINIQNESIQYYQNLMNMLNKSFLSLDLKNKTVSSNKCFVNILKKLGIEDTEIENIFFNRSNSAFEKNRKETFSRSIINNITERRIGREEEDTFDKSDKIYSNKKVIKNTNYQSSRKIKISLNIANNNNNNKNKNNIKITTITNTNLTNSKANLLLNSEENNLKYFNRSNNNLNLITQLESNNKSNFNNKNNKNLVNKKTNNNYKNNDQDLLFLKQTNLPNKKKSSKNLKTLKQRESPSLSASSKHLEEYEEEQQEKEFLAKLDFLLEEIFENFTEDKINTSSSAAAKGENCFSKPAEVKTLSDQIREIFYSANKNSINENFIFKGLFAYEPSKALRASAVQTLKLEVYWRKVKRFKSDFIEFYFNDVTTLLEKVEKERELNKMRSTILAKISHEFKTPLITIIYMLKNYMNFYNDSLKQKSNKEDINCNLSSNFNFKKVSSKNFVSEEENEIINNKNNIDKDNYLSCKNFAIDEKFRKTKTSEFDGLTKFSQQSKINNIENKDNINNNNDINNNGKILLKISNTINRSNLKSSSGNILTNNKGNNKQNDNDSNNKLPSTQKLSLSKKTTKNFSPKKVNAISKVNTFRRKSTNKFLPFTTKKFNAESNYFKQQQPESALYLKSTIDLSDYMLTLISDIVDFSQSNANFDLKCTFVNFNFHNLLKFCHRMLKILIECKGLGKALAPILHIGENVPLFLCSDEMRIKQVILNLVSNSIKFTRRGHIKISATLKEANNIEISIEDTGIGINQNDLNKLFQDFSKVGNTEANQMNAIGSGLGLSICKRIVKKIGNEINVESVIGRKTIFYFNVFSQLPTLRRSLSSIDTRDLKKNGVLVNDDGNDSEFAFKADRNIVGMWKKKENEKDNYNENIIIVNLEAKKEEKEDDKHFGSFYSFCNKENLNENERRIEDKNKNIINIHNSNLINSNNNNKNTTITSKNNNYNRNQNQNPNENISNKSNTDESINFNPNPNSNIQQQKSKKMGKSIFINFQKIKRINSNSSLRKSSSMNFINPELNIQAEDLALHLTLLNKKGNVNGDGKQDNNSVTVTENKQSPSIFENSNSFNYNNNYKDSNSFQNFKLDVSCKRSFSDATVIESLYGKTPSFTDVFEKFKSLESEEKIEKKEKTHDESFYFNNNQSRVSSNNSSSKGSIINSLIENEEVEEESNNCDNEDFQEGISDYNENTILNNYKNLQLNQLEELKKMMKPLNKYLKYINSKKQIILIADDNEIIRNSIKNLIKKNLDKEKYCVICVTDGIEVLYLVMLDQLMKNCIKIIISDEQMNFLNGNQLFSNLFQMQNEKKIGFVILVYCTSEFSDKAFLERNNIKYTLAKPPNKIDILKVFEEIENNLK